MANGSPRPRCPRNTALPTLHAICVADTDDCIEWPYGRDSFGYGMINVKGKFIRTHVLACEYVHGPNPGGLEVAHGCGDQSCVNARHLRWASPTENAHDKDIHGTVVWGEQHPAAKLTEDDVRQIRLAWSLGSSFSELGQEYGIHRVHVRNIVQRKLWKRVA